ncbi:hypothetical protein BX666DRAFT_1863084, partial [Dichotomocladium elegans]
LLEKIRAFRRFVLEHTSRPPVDLIPYQRMLWFLDSDASKINVGFPGMVHDMAHVWHQRLWRLGLFHQSLYQLEPTFTPVKLVFSEGSGSLYQGVQTMTCLNLISFVDKMSAFAYENALGKLKSLKELLATQVMLKEKRSMELMAVISTAYQMLVASAEVMDRDFYTSLSRKFERLLIFAYTLSQKDMYSVDEVKGDYDDIIYTIKDINAIIQSGSLNAFYISAISALDQAIQHHRSKDKESFYIAIGNSRALLGLAFIAAYIPDYPVDPTAEARLRVNLLNHKHEFYTQSVSVRKNIERLATGNDTNSMVREEQANLDRIDRELAASVTIFSLRPAKSQLDDIFVDLTYLQKNLLANNAASLIKILMTPGAGDDSTIMQREALIQGNALQFIDRIQVKYPMYRDILQPLLLAVDDVKYGMRLVALHCKKDRTDEFIADVVELFIRSPGAARFVDLDWRSLAEPSQLARIKSVMFERAPATRKWAHYLGILVVILQRLVMIVDSRGHISLDDLVALNGIFANIVDIWKAAQEFKEKKKAEEEQMYKTRAKKYEPMTEEEQNEADMKKTFADFNEVFADLHETPDGEDLPPAPASSEKVEEESVLDDADVCLIGKLHRSIFDSFRIDTLNRSKKSYDVEILRSYRAAGQLASMTESAFTDSIDMMCGAGHLRATHLTIQRLVAEDSFSKVSDSLYDFYASENVAEAKRVEPIINRFKARVKEIQLEWPEHEILQQLIDISDRLLSFSITSPVAKFLTGVEFLLQKSEDWEAYAAKHVSLRVQREELTALIISWRQLELNCWPKLLAAQEQNSQNAAFEWWFHLYDTVHNTTFDSDSDKDQRIRDLLMTLDQFFQSCSIVEYEPRLKMLDSFYRQARVQAELTGESDQWTIATLLRNVYNYYCQFGDHVQTMLAQLRKPIEKDLKDFVKIASWKDVNIYALRQSAQKTHKQLHKCIRKYREILGMSMLTVIANYNQEHAMFQYGDDKKYNDINVHFVDQLGRAEVWTRETDVPQAEFSWQKDTEPVKRHLADLQGTLIKMRRYCRSDLIVPVSQDEDAVPLESFMTEVIQQIKTFQKETPAVMTEENKSFVKNQKLLKKKALVDFLKTLRHLGLKARPGTMAEQNGDTARLFSQHVAVLDNGRNPMIYKHSTLTEDMVQLWDKANAYYYRSIARLTHLRKIATTEVSRDLSMLEVERSMSATEHMFSMVTKERHVATRFEERLQVLQGIAVQLASLSSATRVPVENVLGQKLTAHKGLVDNLVQMVTEAAATLSIQAEYKATQAQSVKGLLDNVHQQLHEIQRHVDRLFIDRYLSAYKSKALLTADVREMIDSQATTIVTGVRGSLVEVMETVPQMTHVIRSILDKIDAPLPTFKEDEKMKEDITGPSDLRDKLYGVIDAILVSVQDLRKAKSKAPPADAESVEDERENTELAENYIVDQHASQFTTVGALHMDVVAKRSMEAIELAQQLLSTSWAEDAMVLLQQTYPFLQQYILMVEHALGEYLIHHKAMAKMTYGLVNSFTIIISKGFCMPAGAEDDGEEGDADGLTAGTGIGEGEGTKDVSEEIEDEEQVLGTQNEEPHKPENGNSKEEKKGIEMENDFEGEMEDIEKDEEDEKKEESDEEEDEEDDIDEQIGDVDDMDPDAVDDKMWGDEDAPEDRKDSDKTVDQQGQSEQQESDIVAKEEEGGPEPQRDQESKGEQPDEENAEKQGDEQGDEEMEDGDEHEDEEGADEQRAGEPMNVDIPEAETLELPDDLNMDGEENEDGDQQQEDQFNDPMDMDDGKQQLGGEDEDEQMGEEEEGEQFQDPLDQVGQGEKLEEEELPQEEEEMAEATARVEDEKNEEEAEEEQQQQPDHTGDPEKEKGGNIDEDEEQSDEQKGAQNREQPSMEEQSAENQFGVQGQTGKISAESKGAQQGEDAQADSADADQEKPENKESKGMAEQGSNEVNEDATRDEAEADMNEKKTNPQRSLGDALEDWRRRLGDVADAEDDSEEEEAEHHQESDEARVNEEHAFEYIKNDDDAHDMQTMGNAAPDQVQDLKLGAIDETTHDEEHHAGEVDMDEEMPDVDTMPLPEERMQAEGDRETQGAIVSKRLGEQQAGGEGEGLTVDESLIAHEPLDPEQIERMRQELEATVSEWREEGRDAHQARDLWQQYENLTHDLAMGLCEQLRLILEPTLATKLKGDYRTGKRLNMKKIIPYIASQFKKDKIWLRRTKPSKRQYQVMISVDDSKSMSESHSVQLAYETLALISKALSQLEVGDISITSFGERVRLLHPFDQPFTSESGANVLQQFTFVQQKTHVKELIESTLSLFENAKTSTNSELWQLQLIISDGICEDHETLKQLVRRAMDEHIMVIFIVVDNKPEKDSILKMTNVKYATVNGKLSLQMRPYLETFPFQYFMVLRDINALPEALSDALRQYFSFVAA